MSSMIAARIKLKSEFESIEITEVLFDIVKEASVRRIAIKAIQHGIECFELGMIELAKDEILLVLSDSYNREMALPLFGANRHSEVIKFRPQPLGERLANLQEFFEFILKQEQVNRLEVLLTSDDLVFDDRLVSIQLKDFVTYVWSLIEYAKFPSFHYQFCWDKVTK